MNPLDELNAATVTRIHSALLESLKQGGEAPVIPSTALWQATEDKHRCEFALWDEEDQARRRDVPDSAIANSKRPGLNPPTCRSCTKRATPSGYPMPGASGISHLGRACRKSRI